MSNSVPIEAGSEPGDAAAGRAGSSISRGPVDWRYVTSGLLLAVPDRHSRRATFTDGHRAGRPLVAVVNEAFARTYFGRVDVIGQTIAFGNDGPREIIGVVADVKGRSNAGFVRSFTTGRAWSRELRRRSTCRSRRRRTPASRSPTASST